MPLPQNTDKDNWNAWKALAASMGQGVQSAARGVGNLGTAYAQDQKATWGGPTSAPPAVVQVPGGPDQTPSAWGAIDPTSGMPPGSMPSQPLMGPPSELAPKPGSGAFDQVAALAQPPVALGGQPPPRGAARPAPLPARTPTPIDDQGAIDALKAQGLSVDQIKKRLADLQGSGLPLNLAPVAALVDSWTGSKLSQAAQPTETAADRSKTISQLQDAILKGQQGMSQDEMAMLKTKLTNSWHEDEITQSGINHKMAADALAEARADRLQRASEADGAKQTAKDADRFMKASQDLRKDKTMEEATKRQAEIGNLRQQVAEAQSNPAAWNMLPIATVRMFAQRISAPELASASGEKDALGRLDQMLDQAKSGTVSASNAKWLNKLTDSLEKSNNVNIKNVIESHTKNYLSTPGVAKGSLSEVAESLSGGVYSKVKSGPTVGDVEDGHRFKGGDPSDPASWEVAK